MIEVQNKRSELSGYLKYYSDNSISTIRKKYNEEREWWNETKPPMESVRDIQVVSSSGTTSIRFYRPLAA